MDKNVFGEIRIIILGAGQSVREQVPAAMFPVFNHHTILTWLAFNFDGFTRPYEIES